jgi:hypothetical protein
LFSRKGVVIIKHHIGRITRLALPAAVVFLIPALLNTITNAVLRARYPMPGAFYLINSRRMHLYCTGLGSPTVVLDAGGGNDWLIWQKVQPELSKTMRVCRTTAPELAGASFSLVCAMQRTSQWNFISS